MQKKSCRFHSGRILEWCIGEYGESKYQDLEIELIFEEFDSSETGFKGEYDYSNNEIFIYYKKIKNIPDLIQTCIHEFQHYLQPPNWAEKYLRIAGNTNDNPYQAKAERIAMRDWKKCFEALFNRKR